MPELTTHDILSTGTTGLLFGLGSVFLVLVLLICFITLMKQLTKNKQKAKASPAPAVEAPKKDEEDEGEIIAVIAAAIACMAQREGKKFKIKSYRRIKNNRPAWSAGRRN